MTSEAAAVRGSESSSPNLPFLPPPLLEARRPALSIATGWLMAFAPSIALAWLVAFFLPTAQGPQFLVEGPVILLMLVVFAPVVETLIMGGVLAVLLRFTSPTAAVLISAAGWGIAHSLAAPAWGLVIWWPFLIFSTIYVTWSKRSPLAALAMAATVHGLHNLPSALLLLNA